MELHIEKEIIVETRELQHFTLRIGVEKAEDGAVRLIAVDKEGKKLSRGNLVGLSPFGRIVRYPGVNLDLGFEQDEGGEIAVS